MISTYPPPPLPRFPNTTEFFNFLFSDTVYTALTPQKIYYCVPRVSTIVVHVLVSSLSHILATIVPHVPNAYYKSVFGLINNDSYQASETPWCRRVQRIMAARKQCTRAPPLMFKRNSRDF